MGRPVASLEPPCLSGKGCSRMGPPTHILDTGAPDETSAAVAAIRSHNDRNSFRFPHPSLPFSTAGGST